MIYWIGTSATMAILITFRAAHFSEITDTAVFDVLMVSYLHAWSWIYFAVV